MCAFEYQEDAEWFYRELGERLEKFGLELAIMKTRVIPFHQDPPSDKSRFEIVGFEFFWGKDRSGKPHLKRRTMRKRLRDTLRRFSQWCRGNRNLGLRELFWRLNAKLRGYYNYFGVVGNYASLEQFFRQAIRILFKWLNRRSQRRSYNWQGFADLLKHYQVEKPRIVGPPKPRRVTSVALA